MPNILKELQISDVSSVDRGAGRGVRVMLMKRDNQQKSEMDAIAKAQSMNDRQMIEFCKTDAINKAQLGTLIDDLSMAKRRDGESTQQSFVRYIESDPTGIALYKIFRESAGPDHHQKAAADAIKKLAYS